MLFLAILKQLNCFSNKKEKTVSKPKLNFTIINDLKSKRL